MNAKLLLSAVILSAACTVSASDLRADNDKQRPSFNNPSTEYFCQPGTNIKRKFPVGSDRNSLAAPARPYYGGACMYGGVNSKPISAKTDKSLVASR